MKGRLAFLLGLLVIAIVVIALLSVILLSQKQPTQQKPGQQGGGGEGTTISGSYPANIDYEGISQYGNYNPDALTNPNIAGVDLSMNWAQVEPQPGVFNWAPADKVMAAWSNARKKIVIVVRFANEAGSCSINQLTPPWELAKIPSFCDTDGGVVIPDYFNSTFLRDWKAYVQAVAQHLATGPYKNNVVYIRLGVGLGGEGFPFLAQGDYATDDKPRLEQWGYSPTVWASWQKDLMSYYKSVFPFTQIIYPLNGLPKDPITGEPVDIENAQWAASQGIGLGQQGLQPHTNIPIFRQLRPQYPNLYIQFSTVFKLSHNVTSSCDISCVALADIQAAETNGAQFIEWYSQDIINPALQSYFAQWQQYVNSKYGTTLNS